MFTLFYLVFVQISHSFFQVELEMEPHPNHTGGLPDDLCRASRSASGHWIPHSLDRQSYSDSTWVKANKLSPSIPNVIICYTKTFGGKNWTIPKFERSSDQADTCGSCGLAMLPHCRQINHHQLRITGSGLFHLTSAFRISNSWIWSLQQLMAVRRQRLRHRKTLVEIRTCWEDSIFCWLLPGNCWLVVWNILVLSIIHGIILPID